MAKSNSKHKKTSKILITTLILVPVVLMTTAFGFWFGYNDPALSEDVTYPQEYQSWMSYLDDEAKLTEVVMPGSHDAGTKGMMPQAMCQGHTILQQLEGGVRYFDIRVTNNQDKLVIFHGPIKGMNFDYVLNDFATFINENPSEFVIIDFQHIGNNMNDAIIYATKEKLPMEHMLPSEFAIKDINMKFLRDNHYNFMITWNNKDEAAANKFFTRSDSLLSEYDGETHKAGDQKLIEKFHDYYENKDDNKLFVLQAQRTAKTLLGKPSMYEKNFKKHVNDFIAKLKENPDLLKKTNIIMRDFIISDKTNIDLILALNSYKNLYKA